jgi:hypothetical protein
MLDVFLVVVSAAAAPTLVHQNSCEHCLLPAVSRPFTAPIRFGFPDASLGLKKFLIEVKTVALTFGAGAPAIMIILINSLDT